MQIHGPENQPNLGKSAESRLLRSAPKNHFSARQASQPDATASAAAHIAAPEIVQLTSRLNGIPEVRDALLEQVAQRLSSGEYLSRSVAENTAASILDS